MLHPFIEGTRAFTNVVLAGVLKSLPQQTSSDGHVCTSHSLSLGVPACTARLTEYSTWLLFSEVLPSWGPPL